MANAAKIRHLKPADADNGAGVAGTRYVLRIESEPPASGIHPAIELDPNSSEIRFYPPIAAGGGGGSFPAGWDGVSADFFADAPVINALNSTTTAMWNGVAVVPAPTATGVGANYVGSRYGFSDNSPADPTEGYFGALFEAFSFGTLNRIDFALGYDADYIAFTRQNWTYTENGSVTAQAQMIVGDGSARSRLRTEGTGAAFELTEATPRRVSVMSDAVVNGGLQSVTQMGNLSFGGGGSTVGFDARIGVSYGTNAPGAELGALGFPYQRVSLWGNYVPSTGESYAELDLKAGVATGPGISGFVRNTVNPTTRAWITSNYDVIVGESFRIVEGYTVATGVRNITAHLGHMTVSGVAGVTKWAIHDKSNVPQQPLPVTLADVINVLTATGICKSV